MSNSNAVKPFTAIPAKKRGKASLFLCCAKATLLLAPKGGEPRSPPLESPIAKCSAGIAKPFTHPTTQQGFSLIEIFLSLLLMGIIASMGISSYSRHFRTARRMEAARALTDLGMALEQYGILHHTYQTATLERLHFPGNTPGQPYRLLILNATDNTYTLNAIPTHAQTADTACATLTLNAQGTKGITGHGRLEDCW